MTYQLSVWVNLKTAWCLTESLDQLHHHLGAKRLYDDRSNGIPSILK